MEPVQLFYLWVKLTIPTEFIGKLLSLSRKLDGLALLLERLLRKPQIVPALPVGSRRGLFPVQQADGTHEIQRSIKALGNVS